MDNNKTIELVLSPSCYVDQPFKSEFRPHLISSEELPLSQETRIWLNEWIAKFKLTCSNGIERFPSPEAYEAFDREGMELWKKLRQELAANDSIPKYELFYYSTRLRGLFKHPDVPMVRRIRLYAEYGCWPTWYVDDVGCFDPIDLPISRETLERLNQWQDVFNNTMNHDYPPDSSFPDEESERLWSREGTRLWIQLQRELGTQYEVLWHVHYQGKTQLMKVDKWLNAFKGQYQQEDIDNASQSLL